MMLINDPMSFLAQSASATSCFNGALDPSIRPFRAFTLYICVGYLGKSTFSLEEMNRDGYRNQIVTRLATQCDMGVSLAFQDPSTVHVVL